MKIYSVFISLLILTAFHDVSFACPQTETGVPACAYFTRADAVFSGKVLKVEDAPKNEDFPAGARKIRFQVLQNFKGADNPTFSLFTADAKTGGGLSVKTGQTWIIYAANDIVFKSFAAFRGIKIEPKETNDELESLKNVIAGKTETAVSGRLFSDSQSGQYAFEPVEITIAGNGKTLNAKTDADGAFDIPVPSAGNYKVELKFPYRAGLKWNEMLLGVSNIEGVPTLFKYEVRLNDGDCNFNIFEVTKK